MMSDTNADDEWEYELVDHNGRHWVVTPEAARDGTFAEEWTMYRRRKPTDWEEIEHNTPRITRL
jgi:hypothetical protein